jgi:tetratricopeptide (TPR) repeat protein
VTVSPEQLWHQAATLHRAGKLDLAEALYRRFVGVRPDVAEGHGNLAAVLSALGRHEAAEAAYRQALAVRRDFPEAFLGLGNVLKAQGRMEDAAAAYRAVLARKPDFAAALFNLGIVLKEQGKREQAVAALSRAAALQPDLVQAHNNLGNLHYEDGRWEDAEKAFARAVALQPGFDKAHNNLGMALHKRGATARAEAAFREAIRLRPDYPQAQDNLGNLLLECGRAGEALDCFMHRALQHRDWALGAENPSLSDHGREQAAHRGRPATGRIEIAGGARLAGPAVNPRNNIAEISEAWRSSRPQLVVVDDLLTPEALDGLRRFCLESTIWREGFDGYVGARPQSGFACPLIAQVAEDFAATYPAIFQDHPLLFAWAFNYQQGLDGIKVHADFAAVNVNFWITPDEANLDPATGGLSVWDVAAPLDWDFDRYNSHEAPIRAFLAESGARATKIPYRCNRAVVFDSDLFHETDTMSFRPGYDSRRINITLLYGTRDKAGAPER